MKKLKDIPYDKLYVGMPIMLAGETDSNAFISKLEIIDGSRAIEINWGDRCGKYSYEFMQDPCSVMGYLLYLDPQRM